MALNVVQKQRQVSKLIKQPVQQEKQPVKQDPQRKEIIKRLISDKAKDEQTAYL